MIHDEKLRKRPGALCAILWTLPAVLLVFLLGCNARDYNSGKGKGPAESAGRKTSQIQEPSYPVANLYGIWTYDPNGPHADFKLTRESYYVVDHDGDGNMPYLIHGDSICVYFEAMPMRGRIMMARNDSMIIAWEGGDPIVYTRWKN